MPWFSCDTELHFGGYNADGDTRKKEFDKNAF
jgi:hypothetical protein